MENISFNFGTGYAPTFPSTSSPPPFDSNYGSEADLKELYDMHCMGKSWVYSLKRWFLECPQDEALVWINSQGKVDNKYTFEGLWIEICKICRFLKYSGVQKGDRVILCYPPGIDFPPCILACCLYGAVAVPVYPADPSKMDTEVKRLLPLIEKAEAKVVLTTTAYRRVISLASVLQRDTLWQSLKWLCTDNIDVNSLLKAESFKSSPMPPRLSRDILAKYTEKMADFCLSYEAPDASIDSISFIQFTSGSTSLPKGAMVSNGNVVFNFYNCMNIAGFYNEEDGDSLYNYHYRDYPAYINRMNKRSIMKYGHRLRSFSWLPVYHDLGLIGHTWNPLYFGLAAYQMSPIDFIRRPHLWVKCMSDYNCTITSAPCFAFDLVVRKVEKQAELIEGVDLSRVLSFMCCAEPVRHRTVEKFLDVYGSKQYGLHTERWTAGYGLAESTLGVSGLKESVCAHYLAVSFDEKILRTENRAVIVDRGGNIRSNSEDEETGVVTLVSSGRVLRGLEVRIVNPDTHCEVAEREVGEIWVAGPTVVKGYFNAVDETRSTFQQSLKHARMDNGTVGPTEPIFMRTGDCGFFHKSELFISGRLKDLLIIRGRNYYPQDIEQSVELSSRLRPGCSAAFGLTNGDEEVLGIAAEIRDSETRDFLGSLWSTKPKQDYGDIIKEIIRNVHKAVGLSPHSVWLLAPKTINKTSSGKVKRFAIREGLISGELKHLHKYVVGGVSQGIHPKEAAPSRNVVPPVDRQKNAVARSSDSPEVNAGVVCDGGMRVKCPDAGQENMAFNAVHSHQSYGTPAVK